MSSVPALQDSWTLLVAPISSGSRPVHGPVLFDCRLPSGIGLCVGSVPRDSASQVPAHCLVLASSEAVAIKIFQDLLSFCHSLGIVMKE